MPSPLSVTVPLSEPKLVATVTVSPPEVRLLPLASLSWTVMVLVLEPTAMIEVGAAVIVDWVASAGPRGDSSAPMSQPDPMGRVSV